MSFLCNASYRSSTIQESQHVCPLFFFLDSFTLCMSTLIMIKKVTCKSYHLQRYMHIIPLMYPLFVTRVTVESPCTCFVLDRYILPHTSGIYFLRIFSLNRNESQSASLHFTLLYILCDVISVEKSHTLDLTGGKLATTFRS